MCEMYGDHVTEDFPVSTNRSRQNCMALFASTGSLAGKFFS